MRTLLCSIAFLFILLPATAQDYKARVQVKHTGDDRVGNSFAYEIREKFRKSSAFDLKSEYPRLTITLTTISTGDMSVTTTYSVVWTFDAGPNKCRYFVNNEVGSIGNKRLKSTARGIIAATDEIRRDLKKIVQSTD